MKVSWLGAARWNAAVLQSLQCLVRDDEMKVSRLKVEGRRCFCGRALFACAASSDLGRKRDSSGLWMLV